MSFSPWSYVLGHSECWGLVPYSSSSIFLQCVCIYLWTFSSLIILAVIFIVLAVIFIVPAVIFKLLTITSVLNSLAIVSATLFISIKMVINFILYASDWVRKMKGHPRKDWSTMATQAFSDVKSQVRNVQNTIKVHSPTAAQENFQIPFRKTGSQMIKLITSIPWMQMIHVVQSSLQILLVLIQIAFPGLRFALTTIRLAIQGVMMTLSSASFVCRSLIVVLGSKASTPQPKAKAE